MNKQCIIRNIFIKMYHNIMWFYVFVLTFLDISLNTKLSALGKSQDVQIHDTLVEGITFQEWGGEVVESGVRGRSASEGVILRPAALNFGRAALAAPHARSVTLTNAANATLHLASVAGTTPDFHASFFESKTLAPQANTTFSVVYLGRREGPVSAHLYIHTSLGVYKYPVSAVGVASEWGLWPLVGVRVPLNATLEPLLTMHNPTDETIQVSEVYSSGGWLGLQLPEGGRWAPRDRWTLPPHSSRDIVRLRLQPPHAHHHQHQHPLTAYIRIKANMTGGGLVVGVEAKGAPPGEYLSPIQLPLTARGSRDPPDTFSVEAGNSLDEPVTLESGVWGARCSAAPPPPASAPPPPPPASATPTANGYPAHTSANGGAGGSGSEPQRGVHVSLVRAHLDAHQPLTHAAQLTLDYSQMWASYGGDTGEGAESGAWCSGWARVGRAALPYSLRLLPGTLALLPDTLHFITSLGAEAKRAREVRVRNEFPVPVLVAHAHCPPSLLELFHCETLTPLLVTPGEQATVARLRLRSSALAAAAATLRSEVTLRTNLTQYSLPVLLYSGQLDPEWEWPNSSDGTLRMGAVGASSTRRVGLRLHNRGPAPLCVTRMRIELPGAQVALAACANVHPVPEEHACRCVPAGAWAQAWVTVVAPARSGPLSGALDLHTAHAHTRVSLELHAHAGRLAAHTLHLPPAAPYAWSSAPIVLESSMSLRMRVVNITQHVPDPAVTYVVGGEESTAEISTGRHTVGELLYKPENLCQPNCYTGLDISTPEGAAWVRRGEVETDGVDGQEAGLQADTVLQVARYTIYARSAHAHDNLSLHLHTTQVVQVPVKGSVERWWPRLVRGEAGGAGLAGVGASVSYKITVRNPSRSHPLLLQPVIATDHYLLGGADESPVCKKERCVWSRDTFHLAEWGGTRGAVREWRPPPDNCTARLPTLLMSPDAEVDIKVTFAPKEPSLLAAYLYLRNNLTILEGVQLWGRGAYPSFELGGRRPGTNAPILFEVRECAEGSGAEGSAVRRTVVARNTGPVPVRLRDWRLAGVPCQARGFRLQPCGPLTLAPNESRALHVAFAADYSLARVPCRLRVRAGTASTEFSLLALAPAALLPRCAPRVHRPPFEPALRAAGTLLALLGLALVLAAAAIDAERELRRVRPPRSQPPDRAPLDLRALARPVTPAPAPRAPPVRRRRQPRRPPAPSDAHAERRAFERWRSRVLRAADDDEDDDSRSSEDLDVDRELHSPIRSDVVEAPVDSTDRIHLDEDDDDETMAEERSPRETDADPIDGYEADPETEERPCGLRDEDAVSTDSASVSSTSSSPADERDGDEHVANGNLIGVEPVDIPRDRVARPDPSFQHGDGLGRGTRPRRDTGETRRIRTDGEAGRARAAKQQARRDKGVRRRSERAVSPTRDSPPRGTGETRAPAVRWGASWSSVVAAGAAAAAGTGAGAGSAGGARAPLPPIGSDVRRRAEPTVVPADNSLFFFNGETPAPRRPDSEYAWRARPDYLEEGPGAFRSMGSSVWGGAAEAWGVAGAGGWGAALRPPPGFPAAPPPARIYDPFHSLSAIWEPNVFHWNDTPAPPAQPERTLTVSNTSTSTSTSIAGSSVHTADDKRQDSPR